MSLSQTLDNSLGASESTSDGVITCLQRDSLRVPVSSKDVTESQRNQNAQYQGIARHRVEGEPVNLLKMSVSSKRVNSGGDIQGPGAQKQQKPDHRKVAGKGRLCPDSSHGYLRVTSC